jgi:biopolymer transport protein ExbB
MVKSYFLNVVQTGLDSASYAEAQPMAQELIKEVETISVIDLIIDGGWPMIPLAALFIWAIYIYFERNFFVKRASKIDPSFMEGLKLKISDADIKGAKTLCQDEDSPVSRMMEKGVSRLGKPLKDIEASIENVGKLEVFKMEKSMSMLATIAGAAPMIGFLGTVLGMISTFHEMHQAGGDIQLGQMAGGIMQSLVTTVAGLIVGIIAYVGYNTLVSRIDKVVHKMEASSLEFLDVLHEPA